MIDRKPSLFPAFDRAARGEEPFNDKAPAQRHSPTSRAAAEAVQPKVGTQKALVYETIRAAGERGLADFEGMLALAERLASAHNAYRARRVALVQDGVIERAPFQRVNPVSGLACDVFRVPPGKS